MECDNNLMKHAIETTVEMPAVAGRTLKSFIGKGESAKRLSRRTGVLAVGVGLILFGPVASMKGGALEEFGMDILSTLTIEAVEDGVDSGLNAINDPTGITGVLMGLLGDTTTGQLDKISSQVTVAQNMIAGLQSDLDTFESNVQQDFQQVLLADSKLEFKPDYDRLINDYYSLSDLAKSYSNVVACCYSNGVLKTNLSTSDLLTISGFVTGDALNTVPANVLKDLAELSTSGAMGSVYDDAFGLMSQTMPFQHQTYAGMYNLFNYMASMRATALFLKKESLSYAYTQRTVTFTNTTLGEWMASYLLPTTAAYGPGLTDTATQINNDIANNAILLKMATLLTSSVATNGPQRLAYLQGLITTNYSFPGGSQVVYKVICNANQCTYLIPTNAGTFPYHMVSNVEVPYPALNYPMKTSDGRYQLEPDVTGLMNDTLNGLLTLATAVQPHPLNYLTGTGTGHGGLTNLPSGVNGILLGKTVYSVNTQSLYLLDAQGYNGSLDAGGEQYLTNTSGANVTLADVSGGKSYTFYGGNNPVVLNQATFLTVYYDSDIAASTKISNTNSPNVTGAYYPTTPSALELGFPISLSTGEVLDLSHLYGSVNAVIRICGDATIIGGGPSGSISNLMIETYGGTLTVSNLFLTSVTNIINNVSGTLALVALGTNHLQSTLVETYDSAGYGDYGYQNPSAAVIGAQGNGSITFTGPGALVVTTSSTNFPAVLTEGAIFANGASNLTFSSQSPNSVYSGVLGFGAQPGSLIYIINSKVTSQVGVENDNEFVAGTVTLGNSVLKMSYGIINPNLISPCTWLGKIRGKSQFAVQQSDSGIGIFKDGIYVQLVGTTGTSEFINLNSLPNNYLRYNGTATFNMSYSITNTVTNTGTGDFQGLGKLQSIQIYKENDIWFTWTLDWADITPNVSGDVASTYHVAGNPTTFGSGTSSFPAVENNNPYNYTVNPDNTVTLNVYYGSVGAVTVPPTVHGQSVTSIETGGFENNTALTSVIIPGSVTALGATAFYHCYNLTAVYFQGNAPTLMPSLNGTGFNNFAGDTNAIVYYMPGTTGWAEHQGGGIALEI